MDSIMVKVTKAPNSDFIAIFTYERKYGGRGRFLIAQDNIKRVISGPRGTTVYDSDCGNYAEYYRVGDKIMIQFAWLTLHGDGALAGFRQTVGIPITSLTPILNHGGSIKLLYHPGYNPCTIDSHPASTTIRYIVQDKRLRRAFAKAMRRFLQWRDDKITLYPDGKYSFYFTTQSGFPKNGGLILHSGTIHGYAFHCYTVHT